MVVDDLRTTDDVFNWFIELLVVEHVSFHPDDLFRDSVWIATGEPYFTPERAAQLDEMMVKAHEICDAKGVDICEIAMNAYNKTCIYQKRK